ncbi:MAG TPA: hypothetical protein VHP11_11480 [Tepidisphaeraceae bacterium]|nr:hypothetical protein [Tepidisphaeraceae bacterium]
MAMQNIKRWQWILVSLLVGLVMGYIQHLPREDWQRAFGDTIPQRQFEEGLTREQSGLRWFRNLVVYPERVESVDKTESVYVVAGDCFNGKLEVQDGQQVAVWHRRCFIAEGPYRPITPVDGFTPGGTVLAYLKSLPGTSYTYAWWRDSRWGIAFWTAGSFGVIGLIWPTVINLLVFGSFFRPQEEKGIDLSQVSSQSQTAGSQVSEADLAAVDQMGTDLEAKLAADASSSAPQAPAESAPVKTLTATTLEVAATDQAQDEKAFGQDRDDFYPTERHQQPPKSE